jgi:pyridoxine 4-dehydrogenase
MRYENHTTAGTFAIGGDLPVRRLGYGTMQLRGPGVWGEPRDHDEAIRVLRRAVELGVTLIDTADSYGPEVSERLIRAALHPYPADLVVATKAGMTRSGPNQWDVNGRPEYLKGQAERSLDRLGLERIELFQLHRIDPAVPMAEQLGNPHRPAEARQDWTYRPVAGLGRRSGGGSRDDTDRDRTEQVQPLRPEL